MRPAILYTVGETGPVMFAAVPVFLFGDPSSVFTLIKHFYRLRNSLWYLLNQFYLLTTIRLYHYLAIE